jgi:hypothetical protein
VLNAESSVGKTVENRIDGGVIRILGCVLLRSQRRPVELVVLEGDVCTSIR